MNCKGSKLDGSPCGTAFGLSSDGLCYVHDPLRAVEFVAMQRTRSEKSAKRRQELATTLPPGLPKAPKTLADAIAWASWATHAVAAKIIDARTAHEVAVLVREFRMALEKRDIESEVARLRAVVADLQKQRAAQ